MQPFHNYRYMSLSIKQEQFDKQLDLTQIRYFRKTGDLDTLGKLYNKYMPLIYGVGLKYLKDRRMAQDLVMQVFENLTVDVLKHEILNFKSWLFVIAKNQCFIELEKKNVKSSQFENWLKDQQRIMENGFDIHPIDDELRLSSALKECIERLKGEQRNCIDLFYFKRKCYQEIALTLKVEELKVKSNIQNGKRNLKICMEATHVNS